jgi:hypothetical protein
MFLCPGVQFKSVERNALRADRNLCDVAADLRVEAVAVHAEVARRIAESDEAGEDRYGCTPHRPR